MIFMKIIFPSKLITLGQGYILCKILGKKGKMKNGENCIKKGLKGLLHLLSSEPLKFSRTFIRQGKMNLNGWGGDRNAQYIPLHLD